MEVSQTEWKSRETLLLEQCETAKQQQINLDISLADLKTELESTQKEMAAILKKHESEKSECFLKLKMVEQEFELARESERKEKCQVESLEEKVKEMDRKNEDLLRRLEDSVQGKQKEADSQLETVTRLQDLVHTLKESESENVRLSACLTDAERRLQNYQTELDELGNKNSQLENKLESEEKKNSEKFNSLVREKKELLSSHESEFKKLKDELVQLKDMNKNMIEESETKHSREITLLKNGIEERNQILSQSFHALYSLCRKDVCDDDIKNDIATLNEVELTEKFKSYISQFSEERKSLHEELSQEQNTKTDFENNVHKLQKENSEILEKLENLKSAYEDMKGVTEKNEKELRATISTLNEKTTSGQELLDAARAELANKTELLESRSVRINEMEALLETKTGDIGRLTSTLDRSRQAVFQLLTHVTESNVIICLFYDLVSIPRDV